MPFQEQPVPGKMRHTFTGLRQAFANLSIHAILNNPYRPFREELVKRSELGKGSRWQQPMVTFVYENLQVWADRIRQYTAREREIAPMTLAQRLDQQAKVREKALTKDTQLEKLAAEAAASEADQSLNASVLITHSLTIPYDGTDADWPQPTPARVPNDLLRAVLVGSDYLCVKMTQSHSADDPRVILEHEANEWVQDLVDIYQLVANEANGTGVHYPTHLQISERDNVFNADGSRDPALDAGIPASGDQGVVKKA